jgi:hypothetical protein
MDLQIQATFQLMNALDWGNLLEWTYNLGDLGFWRIPFGNWVTFPSYYDARILPDDLKKVAIERINKFFDSKKDVTWDIGEEQWLGITKSNLVTLEENFAVSQRKFFFLKIFFQRN